MSRKRSDLSVLLPTAGMETCRLYAVAAVLFLVPGASAYPFVPGGLALTAALLLSRGLLRLSARRVVFLLVHLAGFVVAVAGVLRSYGDLPFAAARGLSGWIEVPGLLTGWTDWVAFVLVLIWTGVFWLRGTLIGFKEVTHRLTVGRFDVGLGILFFVYFIRMGIEEVDPDALRVAAAYFIFGIISLYAARGLSRDRAFLNTRSAWALLLPSVAGFLLAGAAAVLLYPYSVRAAGEAYTALGRAAGPLTALLIAILRFLLGRGFGTMAADAAPLAQDGGGAIPPSEEPGFWAQLIQRILAGGAVGLFALVSTALVGWLVFRLVKYLMARSGREGVRFRILVREMLAIMRAAIRRLFHSARRLMVTLAARRRPAGVGAAGFRRLCRWGRLSGLPRNRNETPAEYGRRLVARFPAVAPEAAALVRVAEAEYYGGRLPGDAGRMMRSARRRLSRPGLLPARIASRLLLPISRPRHSPEAE